MNYTSPAASLLETIQWFVFMLANAVALPIVIGSIYQLDYIETAGLIQRTFFTVGIASMLQGLFGHRLPIMEIPAGIWVSVFTVMAMTGARSRRQLYRDAPGSGDDDAHDRWIFVSVRGV